MTTMILKRLGSRKATTARMRKGREAEHDIHETHDDFIDKASEIAADEAEQGADGDGDTHGHEAHPEGNASAVEEPREHVAPQDGPCPGEIPRRGLSEWRRDAAHWGQRGR